MNALPQIEPLLDVNEAAQILKCSAENVRRKVREGVIPCVRIGYLLRFRASALDEWIRLQSSGHLPHTKKETE